MPIRCNSFKRLLILSLFGFSIPILINTLQDGAVMFLVASRDSAPTSDKMHTSKAYPISI